MKPISKKRKSSQTSFFPKLSRQHGGSLAAGKRRKFRPMNPRQSLHITLKSHHAVGGRCLFRHKKLILRVMRKAQKLFHIKVYEYAFAGNHMHLLIKGYDRESLQNFFRVFAGHSAQGILKICPLPKTASSKITNRGGAPAGRKKTQRKPCRKNQRRFWSYLIYTRIVSWGRDFRAVARYIERNSLETLKIIAYTPRRAVPPPLINRMKFSDSS
jgi:REP element-mobilizing transposase RayT